MRKPAYQNRVGAAATAAKKRRETQRQREIEFAEALRKRADQAIETAAAEGRMRCTITLSARNLENEPHITPEGRGYLTVTEELAKDGYSTTLSRNHIFTPEEGRVGYKLAIGWENATAPSPARASSSDGAESEPKRCRVHLPAASGITSMQAGNQGSA